MASTTVTTTTLAEHIFSRLRQIGLGSIFGVPGDYNLKLLDHVEPSGLRWVGSCNELNAGYAADGYARVNGIGALITTFGVGELSAVNAIAGSYAELVPVVHIVGTPARAVQDSRALVHHTLGDGEYGRFAKMYEQVTVAQVDLRDVATCTAQVDWVLGECLRRSRPVYIRLPDDMAVTQIDSSSLHSTTVQVPMATSLLSSPPVKDKFERVSALIWDRMNQSQQPAILVDGESRAFGILNDIGTLIEATGWHTWTTGFGKGLVDETRPNVHGIYQGANQPAQKTYFDSADLVLSFGPHHSRTNSYFGSAIPERSVTVEFGENTVRVGDQIFADVPSRHLVPRLVAALNTASLTTLQPNANSELDYNGELEVDRTIALSPDLPLNHRNVWPVFNPLIESGDVVFCETGTAAYGGRSFRLPANTPFFTSVTWLSIGFMLPAALGTAQANRDRRSRKLAGTNGHSMTLRADPAGSADGSRTILFIGDGSLQLTVQEISTIIAQKLNVTIVVVNNDGYTIERCIHGLKQKYNDVVEWDYLKAPQFFSRHGLHDPAYPVRTFSARTIGELTNLVHGELGDRGPGFRMLEIFLGREDAPMYLRKILDVQLQSTPSSG